jgi:hypothetical protein
MSEQDIEAVVEQAPEVEAEVEETEASTEGQESKPQEKRPEIDPYRVNRGFKHLKKELRELRSVVPQLQAELAAIKANANQSSIPKPTLAMFGGDEDAFSEAVYAYKLATQQGTKQPEQKSNETKTEAIDPQLMSDWQARLNHASRELPDIHELAQKVAAEGIGDDLSTPAVSAIMASPIGPHIYRYLALNPDHAEDIEMLPPRQQVSQIRILEQHIQSHLYTARAPQQAQHQPSEQATAPQQPVTRQPTLAAPNGVPRGGSAPVTKRPDQAKSADEFWKLRMAAKKAGTWR